MEKITLTEAQLRYLLDATHTVKILGVVCEAQKMFVLYEYRNVRMTGRKIDVVDESGSLVEFFTEAGLNWPIERFKE